MQNLTDKDKVNLEGITFSTLKKLLLISFRIAVNVSSYKEQQINMSNYFDVTIISIDKKKNSLICYCYYCFMLLLLPLLLWCLLYCRWCRAYEFGGAVLVIVAVVFTPDIIVVSAVVMVFLVLIVLL